MEKYIFNGKELTNTKEVKIFGKCLKLYRYVCRDAYNINVYDNQDEFPTSLVLMTFEVKKIRLRRDNKVRVLYNITELHKNCGKFHENTYLQWGMLQSI